MDLKIGEPLFICGNWSEVRNLIYGLSVKLQRKYRKILLIDTTNTLIPHHPAFSINEGELLKNIYCVRAEKPYDLLARLKTSDGFIRKNRIGAILVNPLNVIFEDSHPDEVVPMTNNILNQITLLAKRNRIVAVVGNVIHSNENIMKSSAVMMGRENLVMVK